VLKSSINYDNPYISVDVWAQFISDNNDTLIRPAFWDGGNIWQIRFAPPDSGSLWRWTTFSEPFDKGLSGKTGYSDQQHIM